MTWYFLLKKQRAVLKDSPLFYAIKGVKQGIGAENVPISARFRWLTMSQTPPLVGDYLERGILAEEQEV